MRTVWVFGDQLRRDIGALADATPSTHRVLFVISDGLLTSKRWHRQRAHLVISAIRHFAAELSAEGFDVDVRQATSLSAGLAQHVAEHRPERIVCTEPNSFDARQLVERLGVEIVRSNQFLCHYDEFAAWADTKKRFKLEDFYRWQRVRLNVLMDGSEPAGGAWNFDHDNREPPPKDGRAWPEPRRFALDDIDRAVLADQPDSMWGAESDGSWPVTRAQALQRLDDVITHVLPTFGPHEDAMLSTNWHLAHSTLAAPLNLGLLSPLEIISAAEAAYRAGHVPIASAEGFIRQILGWREYVWGVYWRWMPEYRTKNVLAAHRPVPPVLTGDATTHMRCVEHAMSAVHDHAYAHHIQRLMVLGNLALLSGVDPWAMTEWMWASFIDAAEWVMLPNVVGMTLHADGGMMATKPYAAGGAYIDKMSDYCKGCHYDRKARVGERACPFTTLYWDFLARHHDRFVKNPRVAQQVRAAEKLSDLPAVRERAVEVLRRLDVGSL
jgi:deoxyribodipyrimidine photolyase-related protein